MIELPGYEYVNQLGTPGFFGEVWLARNHLSGQEVAIKHIDGRKIDLTLDAWSAEAAAMAACEHPNLVPIYHAEITPDGPALVMKYLPSGAASSRWSGGPVPVGLAVQAAIDVCWGLHHLHARGLTHRDIKPANILFDGEHAVLGDFGLAAAPGSPAPALYVSHAPPEVRAGGAWTPVADVYALGVTLYRLLCGDDAAGLTAPNAGVLIASGKWPDTSMWPVHVHKRLRTAVRAATQRDANRRPQSAADLRDVLEAARPTVSFVPNGITSWSGDSETAGWEIGIDQRVGAYDVHVRRDLGKGPRRVAQSRGNPTEQSAQDEARRFIEQIAATGAV